MGNRKEKRNISTYVNTGAEPTKNPNKKKKLCAVCGRKANFFTRTKLSDGNFLCRKCLHQLPLFMRKSVKDRYTLFHYKNLLEYIEMSDRDLRPLFCETDRYYNIHLDTDHELFYLGSRITNQTVFFKLQNVAAFDLVFKGEEYINSLSGPAVKGKLLLELEVRNPYFYHEAILDTAAKGKARKTLYGTKVAYEPPRGMEPFLDLFLQACNASQAATAYESDLDQKTESSPPPSELQQAMALFMIDRLEDATMDQIRQQRNRLIKTFHPDKGSTDDTNYAQKINAAYETLLKYIQ